MRRRAPQQSRSNQVKNTKLIVDRQYPIELMADGLRWPGKPLLEALVAGDGPRTAKAFRSVKKVDSLTFNYMCFLFADEPMVRQFFPYALRFVKRRGRPVKRDVAEEAMAFAKLVAEMQKGPRQKSLAVTDAAAKLKISRSKAWRLIKESK